MNGFYAELQANLLDLLKKNYEYLIAFTGVHYLDVGYRYFRGRLFPHLAIRVHVHQKLPPANLETSQLIPRYIDQIPVDVIQSNPHYHTGTYHKAGNPEPGGNPRYGRFNPLTGGIAIRNPRFDTVGTLGCIAHDQSTGDALGLSNYHVLVDDSGEYGDNISQPGILSNEDIAKDIVGQVIRWNEPLDCAVFSLNNSREFNTRILGLPIAPSGTGEAIVGTHVIKSGLTTGVTYGIIDGVSFDEFTIVPELNPTPNEEISGPGDSGSIWLERLTGKTLGLHYAGETDPAPEAERAWAKRLTKVCAALNISL